MKLENIAKLMKYEVLGTFDIPADGRKELLEELKKIEVETPEREAEESRYMLRVTDGRLEGAGSFDASTRHFICWRYLKPGAMDCIAEESFNWYSARKKRESEDNIIGKCRDNGNTRLLYLYALDHVDFEQLDEKDKAICTILLEELKEEEQEYGTTVLSKPLTTTEKEGKCALCALRVFNDGENYCTANKDDVDSCHLDIKCEEIAALSQKEEYCSTCAFYDKEDMNSRVCLRGKSSNFGNRICEAGISFSIWDETRLRENVVEPPETDEEKEAYTPSVGFPVSNKWDDVAQELLEVWDIRAKTWETAGAYEGLVLDIGEPLPEDLTKIAEPLYEQIKFGNLSVSLTKQVTTMIKNRGVWRLSFLPSAIIGAAQHNQSMDRALACFGFEKEYEGTAAQMVFDPTIAVFERVCRVGKHLLRTDGFQMVAIAKNGICNYGGLYEGFNIDGDASRILMKSLAAKMCHKLPYSRESIQRNNDAAETIAKIANANGGKMQADSIKIGLPEEYSLPEREYSVGRNGWYVISGVVEAYEESSPYSFTFNTGLEKNLEEIRPFSDDDINKLVQESDIISGCFATCEECGDAIRDEDDAINGDDYGVDGYFCCQSCLESTMQNVCTDSCNGVYLINGSLYSVN